MLYLHNIYLKYIAKVCEKIEGHFKSVWCKRDRAIMLEVYSNICQVQGMSTLNMYRKLGMNIAKVQTYHGKISR